MTSGCCVNMTRHEKIDIIDGEFNKSVFLTIFVAFSVDRAILERI